MPTKREKRKYLKPILPTVLIKSLKFKGQAIVVKSYPKVKFATAIGATLGLLLSAWTSLYWRLRRNYR